MDKRFEEQLKEGVEDCLTSKGLEMSKVNSIQLGRALIEYYMTEIGQYLFRIPEDEIEGAICDGKNDLGIDFVFRQETTWLLIQSKYKGQSNSVSAGEIADFFNVTSRLNDPVFFDKHASASLKDLLLDYRPGDAVNLILLTNDKISQRIEDEFKKLQVVAENEAITYELKGLSAIKQDYKSVVSEGDSLTDDVEIVIDAIKDTLAETDRDAYVDLSAMIDRQEKYKAVICTIKGTSLKSLWQRYKSRLFNYNIRGFLGENAINKSMKETLENDPEKFYFYNNGISAICTEIIPYPGDGEIRILRCRDFSVINGAQTTTTIGKFKNVERLKHVQVLLKLTKAEDYKKEKGLNKRIITFNNSQTVIKASDFRANDPIQMFLENKLSGFLYKGTVPHQRVFYLRKRLKVERKRDTLYVSLETLARVLYAFDHDPSLIFKGTKYLFDPDTESGKYWTVFGENGQEVDAYGNKRLERIAAIYFIWLRVEMQIRSLAKTYKQIGTDTIKYQALQARWHIMWAYGYVLNTFHTDHLESILKKVANGSLFDSDRVTFIERWFPKVHNTITKCIEKNYNTRSKNEEVPSFNFKNWLRSSSDFEEVQREFKYMDISDYPTLPASPLPPSLKRDG